MPIEVKATQAGTIGWLIAIAAGIVLIGSSALRIHQVAKERGNAGTEAPPTPGIDGPDGQPGVPPHPAQVVPPASETDHPETDASTPTDRGDHPRDPESLDV